MYTCGIDVGSVSTEVVILDNKNNKIMSYVIALTGSDSKNAAKAAFESSLMKAGLKDSEIKSIVATGYGRINIPFANKNITEISCHARGAVSSFPDLKTVIDIGGQDSKVIKLEGGSPIDFLMNDKCAAGTGRFLEVMAKALEIDLEEFTPIFNKTSDKVAILQELYPLMTTLILSTDLGLEKKYLEIGMDNFILKGNSAEDFYISMVDFLNKEQKKFLNRNF